MAGGHVRRATARALAVSLRASVAAVTTAALVLGMPAPAQARVTGSSSGGDPYFPQDGNGGYQVEHYRIHDTVDPGSGRLRGWTVLRSVSDRDLDRFHVDLVLQVDSVTVNGRPARWSRRTRHEVRITPARALPRDERFRVVVRYHGRPAQVTAVRQRPVLRAAADSRPAELLALGEPQIGPWWFAANETPADKATYDITVRVPRGQQALSSGALVERRRSGPHTVWRWRVRQPTTTYLVFLAAGSFVVDRRVDDGRPGWYAVSRRLGADDRRRSMALLKRTPEVLSWLSEELTHYPFTEHGGVVTGLRLGFALETQTRPVYPLIGGPNDSHAVSLLVHELAHQWFGDHVAVARWRDIWLNEGFASYVEWAWEEAQGGTTVADRLAEEYGWYAVGSSFWTVRVADPGRADLFSWPVYHRGAMTLAALRHRIGDADFTRLLREWLRRNGGGHGDTAAFTALAEEVSGEDLGTFFTAWLERREKPAATSENGVPAGTRR